jgi:penicillin-binding protein 2
MEQTSSASPRLRLGILGVVILSLFGALFARLWYLQVMATDRYQEVSQANRVRVVMDDAPRGRILDTTGRVLVDNRTSLVVTIDPAVVDSLDRAETDALYFALADELTTFGVPTKVSHLERRMSDAQYSRLQPIPVAVDVPPELQLVLAERSAQFPGVDVHRESVREYPHGTLAVHIVGYVGRISPDELEEQQGSTTGAPVSELVEAGNLDEVKPYQPDSTIGKTGVEALYEAELRGVPGVTRLEVDSEGRPVRVIDEQAPVPGNDLVLTVNLDIQQQAEVQLAAQLDSLRGSRTRDGRTRRTPAGSVVVEDPRDGGVLGMASYPTFDPAEFVNGISTERYEALTGGSDDQNPLTNRAVGGLYAPGSTFKLVTAYAGLTSGVIGPNDTINDPGYYQLPDCTGNGCEIQNAQRQPHGSVDLRKSLTVSSDTFYYRIGDLLWRGRSTYGDPIQDAAKQFGLGQPTGLGLQGEVSGIVPTPEQKRQRHEENPEAFPYGDWYTGDNVNLSIGQGDVLISPIQLANAYSTFANGGTRFQPRLARAVVVPGGDPAVPADVVKVLEPVVLGTVDIPPSVRAPIESGLAGVASQSGGTATSVFQGWDTDAWPIASKTGTAQVNDKADNALFVAYGPVGAPDIVAVALLEEAGFGSEAAAPVVRRVLGPFVGQPPDRSTPLADGEVAD